MTASDYQRLAEAKLKRHFADVRTEWSIGKDANDAFMRDVNRYAPRVDIAVGPFNTTRGKDSKIPKTPLVPDKLCDLFEHLPPNKNPRCLLAIEVIYSGSSKHVLGDILNAGALGLYGLVIGLDTQMPKIRRIHRYLRMLADLEKLPWLFQNVVAISAVDFDGIIGGADTQ